MTDVAKIAASLSEAQRRIMTSGILLPKSADRSAVNHRSTTEVLSGVTIAPFHGLVRRGLLDRWTQESRPLHERRHFTHHFALTPLGEQVRSHLAGDKL